MIRHDVPLVREHYIACVHAVAGIPEPSSNDNKLDLPEPFRRANRGALEGEQRHPRPHHTIGRISAATDRRRILEARPRCALAWRDRCRPVPLPWSAGET